MRRDANRQYAIVVISDGGDWTSRYSERRLLERLRESDVPVYTIHPKNINIFRRLFLNEKTKKMEYPQEQLGFAELHGGDELKKIAEASGGAAFEVRGPLNIPVVAKNLNFAIRHSYLCSFKPTDFKKTKDDLHDIKLQVIRPGTWDAYYKRKVPYKP